jgi:intracellular sulfur oxidation DsrE/DsrF family protein
MNDIGKTMNTRKKVFLIGSESIGRGDEDLGYEILMSMLKTLADHEDRPMAVVFWNMAVKLLAESSPAVPYLKTLEEKGVQLLAGQLCVKELELTGKMAVGREATMDEILDLILHHEVVNL